MKNRSENHIDTKTAGSNAADSNHIINNHNNCPHPYEDIINLPHHVSTIHPQMSLRDRAAQFAPFAAVTSRDKTLNPRRLQKP